MPTPHIVKMESSAFINELSEANSRFDRLELIGEGTYGEVYRGVNKLKNEVAIKVVSNLPNKYDEIKNEMAIFEKFSRHPNMVDYFGTYIFKNENGMPIQIWLIMEYCGGRSVAQLAKTTVYNGGLLRENVIRYILNETLVALKYLHGNRIIHRDIKGPNILLTISGHVKLIDFGVSTQLASTIDRRHSSVGSPFWMAPEVIACEQQLDYSYDNRCDIWSVGITAIELADGDPPLSEEHPMRALFKIPRNPPPTVKNPKKWSDYFLDFISMAVTKDFEKRPTADALLRNPFLEGVSVEEASIRKELMSIIHIINKRFTLDTNAGDDETLRNRQENAKRNIRVLEADDLAKLPRLTDMIILNYLSERYDADQIYTYIGEILIAINPFKDLQIYSEGATLLFQDVQKESLPPHIFMVACTTHQAMIHKRRDQCCVISGESGSGKTVSANYLVHQLAAIGKSNGQGGVNINLVRKILQLNPLMEAFGNAQTVINHNSSRFGKFLELHFTDAGRLVGAKLSEYLLEKSRVVSQPRNERNFHILYYLIAGLDFHKKLENFELDTCGRHRYLNTDELSLSVCACTSEMQAKFTRIQKCFEDLGFTGEEIQSIYCVLAAIIHLGDVDFIVDEEESYEGEKAKVLNIQKLEIASSLLCVDADALDEALTTNSSVTRGETIIHNNDIAQAMECRDATSKALYGRLFSWIVHKINSLLRAEDTSETLNRKIGILDIFGFENFSQNSFEQLCINIANEQMQFFYNEYVFVWELEEYAADGVKGIDIEFKNNKPILDLFLQKPVGLLALLDEESRFPKASDLTLVEKFQDNIQSEYMKTSQETSTFFTIYHYAGKVVYDATGFLEKNRDTLSIDVLHLLRLSTDKTIAALFQNTPKACDTMPSDNHFRAFDDDVVDSRFSSVATSRFQQTVGIHFRQSLRVLLSKIIRSEPHFVRCIRPNKQNKPHLFDQGYVMNQLRYTGIIQTARIRKQGFSDRIPFKEFINRYKFILYYENEAPPATPEVCLAILRKAEIDEEESWKIGRTKVFLKYWHVEALSKCKEKYRSKIITIRKFMRNLFVKLQVRKARIRRNDAATKIRAIWLGYIQRKRYLEELEETKTPIKQEMTKKKESDNTNQTNSCDSTSKGRRRAIGEHSRQPGVPLVQTHLDLFSDERKNSESDCKSFIRSTKGSCEELRTSSAKRENGSTNESMDVQRPHFRNLKRLIQGYEEENWSSDNASDSPSELRRSYFKQEDIQSAADREGEAALEETRSIILLSQIDLASKETYDVLNRTSYPVILSMTSKTKDCGIVKAKTQKLNHKDRMIAVVDGYGDPLKQKYRKARLHYAEAAESNNEMSKDSQQNPPMLGIVEKPTSQKITIDSDDADGGVDSFQQSTRKGNVQNSWKGRSHRSKKYGSRNSCGETYEERSLQFLSKESPKVSSAPDLFSIPKSPPPRNKDTKISHRDISKSSHVVSSDFSINSFDHTIDFSRKSNTPLTSPKTYYKGQPPDFVQVQERVTPCVTNAPQLYNFAGMNLRWSPKTDLFNRNISPHSTRNEPVTCERWSPRKDVDIQNSTEHMMHETLTPKRGRELNTPMDAKSQKRDNAALRKYDGLLNKMSHPRSNINETGLYTPDTNSPRKENEPLRIKKHISSKSSIQNKPYKDDIHSIRTQSVENLSRLTNTQSPIESCMDGINIRMKRSPQSTQQRVLQERRLIEQRIREVQQRRNEQKIQGSRTNSLLMHSPIKYECSYSKFEEHKAFNYLMNDRTLPRNIPSHVSEAQKRGRYFHRPANTCLDAPGPNISNASENDSCMSENAHINDSPSQNVDIIANIIDKEKEGKYHNHKKSTKKKKKGFNYGFHQDNVLRSIKLNKTGRLQELLVN